MKISENYDRLYLNAESRGERVDELGPARGILNGLALAVVYWGVLGLAVWAWRAIR